VNALRTGVSLQTRIGIATGLVVVGDLIGSGEAQERGIVGETPNLAARLQSIAEPNTVVLAEDTRRLLGSLFELQDLGAKELKGIAEPVRAYAALRPSVVESRFEALHGAVLTALVGREEEFELRGHDTGADRILRTCRKLADRSMVHDASSSSNAFASFRSSVSKPSVNQP
jgi:Adenylate and Guanylate cyclase catalytic domain